MADALAEWWAVWSSYRPSDFLMFSPRTYWRLVELANRQAWPLQLAVLAAGGVAGWGLWRDRRWAPRALYGLLAIAWAAVAWGWHWQRYAAINWAATWFGAAFALQAALWLLAAALPQPLPGRHDRHAALALLLAALLYPLLTAIAGRPWSQAETLALSPDPTLLAGLAGLLLARRTWLWPLPLLGCALAGLTLWTMGDTLHALLLPGAALSAMVARARTQR